MVLIDMEKPLSCEGCRFCEYEQGYCTALPVGEWRQITDMSECPLQEQKTGRWILDSALNNRCSVCKCITTGISATKPPFCQWCGAKMEVDDAQ